MLPGPVQRHWEFGNFSVASGTAAATFGVDGQLKPSGCQENKNAQKSLTEAYTSGETLAECIFCHHVFL